VRLTISENTVNPRRVLDIILGATDEIMVWVREHCLKRRR
jgi:hypothetical protein